MITKFEVGKKYLCYKTVCECIGVSVDGNFALMLAKNQKNPMLWALSWQGSIIEEQHEPLTVKAWVPVFSDGSYGGAYKEKDWAEVCCPNAVAYVYVTGKTEYSKDKWRSYSM